MDKDAFQDGLIRITVRDANMVPFAKKKMIGALSFDTSAIYTGNKSHEMYRQWMALMDDEDGDDVGVQGKLPPLSYSYTYTTVTVFYTYICCLRMYVCMYMCDRVPEDLHLHHRARREDGGAQRGGRPGQRGCS